jgi:hypothetical protein
MSRPANPALERTLGVLRFSSRNGTPPPTPLNRPFGKTEALLRAGAYPDRRATAGRFAGLTARQMAHRAGKAAEALLAAFPRKAPPTDPRQPTGR